MMVWWVSGASCVICLLLGVIIGFCLGQKKSHLQELEIVCKAMLARRPEQIVATPEPSKEDLAEQQKQRELRARRYKLPADLAAT